MQAFDKGPWPRMSGRERGDLMQQLARLMEVRYLLLICNSVVPIVLPCRSLPTGGMSDVVALFLEHDGCLGVHPLAGKC